MLEHFCALVLLLFSFLCNCLDLTYNSSYILFSLPKHLTELEISSEELRQVEPGSKLQQNPYSTAASNQQRS